MSLNHVLSTTPENKWMNIGCHDEIVYGDLEVKGSFIAPDLKVDSVHVLNGSAALPSVSFQNSNSSGMYLAATSPANPAISAGGTKMVDIKAGVGVGINNIVPTCPLEVRCNDTDNGSLIAELTNAAGSARIRLADQIPSLSIGPAIYFNSAQPAVLSSLGNIQLRVQNVGSSSATVDNNGIKLAGGALSTPTYSFISDTDTGILGNLGDQVHTIVGGQPGLVVKKDNTFLSSVVAGAQVTLAGNSTQGFFYLPPINGGGAPTGVPQVFGNSIPITIDPATNKLWAYCATGWKSATLS